MKILNDLAGLRIQLFEMYMVLGNIAGLSTVLPLSVRTAPLPRLNLPWPSFLLVCRSRTQRPQLP
jgi:hypothetical protein